MRHPALILSGLILLFSAKPALAGNSSASVKIKNEINSGSYTSQSTKSETKIHISQEGEGTSSVTVNGKEWKLEGPGEINVNETGEVKESQTPQDSEAEEEAASPTPTTIGEKKDDDSPLSLFEMLSKRLDEIRNSIRSLVVSIWM